MKMNPCVHVRCSPDGSEEHRTVCPVWTLHVKRDVGWLRMIQRGTADIIGVLVKLSYEK